MSTSCWRTIDAIKDDPNVASFTFRASSRWQEGTRNVGEIGRFVHAGQEDQTRDERFRLDSDEPPVLLGNNRGPNAVELLLQALGFCYAVGYVANAAARGIQVTRMEYDVEGDVDVRTFLGLTGPRAGFTCRSPTRATADTGIADGRHTEGAGSGVRARR